jgi:hypothetical protein
MRYVSKGVVSFLLILATVQEANSSSGRIELSILAGVHLPDTSQFGPDLEVHVRPWGFTDEQTFKSLILQYRPVDFKVRNFYRPFLSVQDDLQFRFYQVPVKRIVQPIKKILTP